MNIDKLNVNVFVKPNNRLFISIVVIFLLFAAIIYLNPKLFMFLFNTILGNVVLIILVAVTFYFDFRFAIGLAAIFIMLYQAEHISMKATSSTVEGYNGMMGNVGVTGGTGSGATGNGATGSGFTGGTGGMGSGGTGGSDIGVSNSGNNYSNITNYTVSTWPQQLINQFITYQKKRNPNLIFDIDILQQQATPAEVQYLFKNNKWPWSANVQQLYQNAMAENSYISTNLASSMAEAQSIYNQQAIMELLSWNTKEGEFLINGAVIGHSKGVAANVNNIARCGVKGKMEKVVYYGSGSGQSKITPISNTDIPSIVDGFEFLDGPCNPCTALQYPPNYSCPFSLNTGNGNAVSSVWQNLWGLGATASSGPPAGGGVGNNSFPLLTQLKDELSQATMPILETILLALKNKNNSNSNSSSSNSSSSSAGVTTIKAIKGSDIVTSRPTNMSLV